LNRFRSGIVATLRLSGIIDFAKVLVDLLESMLRVVLRMLTRFRLEQLFESLMREWEFWQNSLFPTNLVEVPSLDR